MTDIRSLDAVLAAHDYTEATNDRAASRPLVGNLRDQIEARLDRVDVICRSAEDDDRDLLASESREIDKLHDEAEAFGRVLDLATPVADRLERTRQEHLRATLAPGRSVGMSAGPVDPMGLTISRSLAREVNEAVRNGRTIRRSLSDLPDFGPFAAASGPAIRGRLAAYGIVSESTSPQAAFVALRPVAPAAPVAEKAAKPAVANATTVAVAHEKISGYVELSTEQIVYGVDVSRAVEDIAIRQLVAGENARVVAALVGAPNITAGTTPAASILAGIAAVAAGGAQPDVIAINPADIPAVLGETITGGGYAVNSGGGAEGLASSLWSVPLVPASGVPAGTAFVWARTALGVSVAMPPTLLTDPYSQSRNNIVTVVVEELAGFGLVQPAQAAEVDLSA